MPQLCDHSQSLGELLCDSLQRMGLYKLGNRRLNTTQTSAVAMFKVARLSDVAKNTVSGFNLYAETYMICLLFV